MPQFTWSGRDTRGNVVSGTLTANTKSDVLVALLKKQIVATDVREAGGVTRRDSNRTFGFLFFAFASIAGGALLTMLAPINVIRCSPAHNCTIEHRIGGIYLLTTDQIANVQDATVEESVTGSGEDRSRKSEVTLQAPNRAISTDPATTPFPSGDRIRKGLHDFLVARNGKGYVAVQGEVILVVPVLLVLLAVHFVRLAFRS